MKLKFKYQKFQADAAKAVVDVFDGQPFREPSFLIDMGSQPQLTFNDDDSTGWRNEPLVPSLTDPIVLENLKRVQQANQIYPLSEKLEGHYNLTIEMETGVGKTYTYIKTMYELNKRYGWSKFIVVVPSIAIREGVYKSFQITEDHFVEEYGKKIRYFVYNSSKLAEIDHFASDRSINVMIINSQAFNATGNDARRIKSSLDEFRSRRPIDVIAKTNPILIIDEPQSVEGKKTKEGLKEFKPLFTLRYSATPKERYNLVYRLDAIDAYNKKLVKKISVKGISQIGTTATDGYVYLESVNLSQGNPTAAIQFDYKGRSGIRSISKTVDRGYDLYAKSNKLDEYKNGFVVNYIDGRDNSLEFLNGVRLRAGEFVGNVAEDHLRRLQIRETIISHIEKERKLFHKGIKVLSLFFIDQVAHYRTYDEEGKPQNGSFAKMFEEEYTDVVQKMQLELEQDDYLDYLSQIPVEKTHEGYFSIDKKGRMFDEYKGKSKVETSEDISAYDLIMKNKELLLDQNPTRSPVRFIFSHSALREGWDNPNVFQICTLKSSSSEVRKRQEVGRGMRLCVNQEGVRMDINVLGSDVQNINVLTVIASESYESFAKGLQSEIADAVERRPRIVDENLFANRVVVDALGEKRTIDSDLARIIMHKMIKSDYVNEKGALTDTYFSAKADHKIEMPEQVLPFQADIESILDSVYDPKAACPEDARKNNIELRVNYEKLHGEAFKRLWSRINSKSVYEVAFDTKELVENAVRALNDKLQVQVVRLRVEEGVMEAIESKDKLEMGEAFVKETSETYGTGKTIAPNTDVKYDLVGRLVADTRLKRQDIVSILTGISKTTFDQFKSNPEDFIIKAGNLINEAKASAICEHIIYHVSEDHYNTSIFTESTIRGQLGANAIETNKNLYDHLVYDSNNERKFAEKLEEGNEVSVYVKLPSGFYISTPVGKYNPDWAIAFREDKVKHIYFVAETKGSLSTLQLRPIESGKIKFAKEHFKALNEAIKDNNVVYDCVDSYDTLLNKVMR